AGGRSRMPLQEEKGRCVVAPPQNKELERELHAQTNRTRGLERERLPVVRLDGGLGHDLVGIERRREEHLLSSAGAATLDISRAAHILAVVIVAHAGNGLLIKQVEDVDAGLEAVPAERDGVTDEKIRRAQIVGPSKVGAAVREKWDAAEGHFFRD